METKNIILMGALLAMTQMAGCASAQSTEATNQAGKCYGVAGPKQGDCGGKDPKTGKTWSCAGQNPTADLGWKKMTKEECDAAGKHNSATTKNFVANK
ncbi:MAG: hypothetical protein MH321_13165 [Leptospiraceae bacterium]|nr:hypothetical protein [Leptospiraceae bacterium]